MSAAQLFRDQLSDCCEHPRPAVRVKLICQLMNEYAELLTEFAEALEALEREKCAIQDDDARADATQKINAVKRKIGYVVVPTVRDWHRRHGLK
jgi:hypothetical protein